MYFQHMIVLVVLLPTVCTNTGYHVHIYTIVQSLSLCLLITTKVIRPGRKPEANEVYFA